MPRYLNSRAVVDALTVTTGPLLLPDGTAAAPVAANVNSVQTGLFFGGAADPSIYATTAGTAFLRMTSDQLNLRSVGLFGWTSGAAGSSMDTILARDAANTLALRNANANQTMRFGTMNAAYSQISAVSELHTLAAAATSDTTITIPANSLVVGVTLRVTTTITGCTTLDVGVAGATTRYGTGIALTSGTTNVSPGTTNPTIYSAATAIRFTAVGGGASFTAGVIRVTVHYISLSAPTS